jgi:aryl-alcohol dehydrogenase-like predicted oxidoreductase
MKKWKNHRRYQIGSLIDVGVYPLTLLTGIFGNVLAVSCWRKCQTQYTSPVDSEHDDENMDFYTLHLEFKNNFTCVLTTTLSFSEISDKASRLELHGTKGILKLNNVWSFNSKVEFVGDGGCDKYTGQTMELNPFHQPPFYNKGDMLSHPISTDWSRLIEYMATDNNNCISDNGKHALHVLEIIENAVKSSSNNGTRICLTYFEQDEILFKYHKMKPILLQKHIGLQAAEIQKNIYPIIYGTMNLAKCEEPLNFLDQAFNMGINAFDLASVYGSKVELIFAKWIESRSRNSVLDDANRENYLGKPNLRNNGFIERKDLYLIGKGGHPFHRSKQKARLNRSDIEKDLSDSLSNLKCTYFDLYLLHRDDPKMFPDMSIIVIYMNEFIDSGIILNWGTSNWTAKRIAEAIKVAKELGLKPPIVESSQFSLAVPSKEIWENAKTVNIGNSNGSELTPDSSHIENRLKNHMYFTWAPLAEGFLAHDDDSIIPQLRRRTWITEYNVKLKLRLKKFAKQRCISIAQASLMYSYFHNNAIIIGTSNVSHLHEIIHGILYFYKWKMHEDTEAFDYLRSL